MNYIKIKWYVISLATLLVVGGIVLQLFGKSALIPAVIFSGLLVIGFIVSRFNKRNNA